MHGSIKSLSEGANSDNDSVKFMMGGGGGRKEPYNTKSVFMSYVYKYVVLIVINVCKLLHVKRPTSSPMAVWNPCKINKALN